MSKSAKERDLTTKENEIKNLINSNDKRFVNAFNFVYEHYRLDYLLGKSNCFLVLKAIYIKNSNLPKWRIAQECNVARSSLFFYRHNIINCFYTCLNENFILK